MDAPAQIKGRTRDGGRSVQNSGNDRHKKGRPEAEKKMKGDRNRDMMDVDLFVRADSFGVASHSWVPKPGNARR